MIGRELALGVIAEGLSRDEMVAALRRDQFDIIRTDAEDGTELPHL
jgi:hypothetical protein